MSRLRIAAHVHSDWSYDGTWALVDLSQAFARRGYDAVLMAEHDRGFDDDRWRSYVAACARESVAGALLVPGIEYSDHRNLVHVPVWGDLPFLGEGALSKDLLRRARGHGAFTLLAHPDRRDAWQALDGEWWELLDAVEIWNRKYDGWAPSRTAPELIARAGARHVPFVGLDFHTHRQFAPLAMVMEADGGRDVEAVYEGLRTRSVEAMAAGVSAQRVASSPGRRVLSGCERLRKRAGRARRLSGRTLRARFGR